MPRHERVSPEEDLAFFYAEGDPTIGDPSVLPAARPAPPATAAPPATTATPAAPAAPTPASPPPLDEPGARPATSALVPTGVPVTTGPEPIVAALVSLVLPGVGQMMCGQAPKGVMILAVAVLTCAGGGLLNLVAALDAFLIAQRKRRGEPVSDWQFF